MQQTTKFSENVCALCGRPLGTRREAHHLVPKSKGGRETVLLHPICHRKIHTVFTNADLARMSGELDQIKQSTEMAKFLRWIAKRPPDFHAPTRA
ncbi:MAG: HNH endonuclease [Pseudomonadota bacterium]